VRRWDPGGSACEPLRGTVGERLDRQVARGRCRVGRFAGRRRNLPRRTFGHRRLEELRSAHVNAQPRLPFAASAAARLPAARHRAHVARRERRGAPRRRRARRALVDALVMTLVIHADPPLLVTHVPLVIVPDGCVNVHGHRHDVRPLEAGPWINVSVEATRPSMSALRSCRSPERSSPDVCPRARRRSTACRRSVDGNHTLVFRVVQPADHPVPLDRPSPHGATEP